MKLLEHQGKSLLSQSGFATPDGAVASEASEAAAIAGALGGRVVIKAQIPSGKRGKSGAIRFADTPAEARQAAARAVCRARCSVRKRSIAAREPGSQGLTSLEEAETAAFALLRHIAAQRAHAVQEAVTLEQYIRSIRRRLISLTSDTAP